MKYKESIEALIVNLKSVGENSTLRDEYGDNMVNFKWTKVDKILVTCNDEQRIKLIGYISELTPLVLFDHLIRSDMVMSYVGIKPYRGVTPPESYVVVREFYIELWAGAMVSRLESELDVYDLDFKKIHNKLIRATTAILTDITESDYVAIHQIEVWDPKEVTDMLLISDVSNQLVKLDIILTRSELRGAVSGELPDYPFGYVVTPDDMYSKPDYKNLFQLWAECGIIQVD